MEEFHRFNLSDFIADEILAETWQGNKQMAWWREYSGSDQTGQGELLNFLLLLIKMIFVSQIYYTITVLRCMLSLIYHYQPYNDDFLIDLTSKD